MEKFGSQWLVEFVVAVLKRFGGKMVSLVRFLISSNVAFRVPTCSQDNFISKTTSSSKPLSTIKSHGISSLHSRPNLFLRQIHSQDKFISKNKIKKICFNPSLYHPCHLLPCASNSSTTLSSPVYGQYKSK